MSRKGKLITLFIEIGLILSLTIAGSIYAYNVQDPVVTPFIIVIGIIALFFLFTLMSIYRDAVDDIRNDDMLTGDKKKLRIFLPFIVNKNINVLHDIKDEENYEHQEEKKD